MNTDNGLVVSIPEVGYEAEKTASGLRIRPVNWRTLRAPTEIEIEIAGSAPAGDSLQRRRLGERDATYRIDSAPGGSGGTERTLHAYIATPMGIIHLQQTVQSEAPADSDFNLGWEILGSARIVK